MTKSPEQPFQIVLCRTGHSDEAIMAAFADADGASLEMVEPAGVAAALQAGANALFLSNSAYDAATAEAARTAPRLGWVQFLSSGTDNLQRFGELPATIRVTNGAEAIGSSVAHHAIALLLGLLRGFHMAERNRREGRWARAAFMAETGSLEAARVVVVGFGAIGRNVASLARAFGADVTIVRRSVRADSDGFATLPLDEALALADAVVIAVPLSPETHHMFDARRLALLPARCRLVNISRGGIIDTPALVRALESGALRGAGLDVFEEEPLAQDSPLWRLENVILTPHVGGSGNPQLPQRLAEICLSNYRKLAPHLAASTRAGKA